MTLIKSVSGFRGTIGGQPGDNLTPPDIVAFTGAYGTLLYQNFRHPSVVVGRDGRISGGMVKNMVIASLVAQGIDVMDLDYSTTPTVEMYVKHSGASGGIIITASHNPAEWNALKFLDANGEFISESTGQALLALTLGGESRLEYAPVDRLGRIIPVYDAIEQHIMSIVDHPLIDHRVIADAGFKVVVDCINSTGSISIPPLLDALGVRYVLLHDDLSGHFAHNPEPLPEHLGVLCAAVPAYEAHLGIAVDPDVDRLALVAADGTCFGEEYTLVCAADYVLRHHRGPVVTNLSSSRALLDLAKTYDVPCYFAPVGEVHVVSEMKNRNAVLGGEGNGGIIDPQLHYGRDALMGIALILMHLATSGQSLSALKSTFASYAMIKDKIAFDPSRPVDQLLELVKTHFSAFPQDNRDGLKVDLPEAWVHIRKSNTEPILRIYAEARTSDEAKALVDRVRILVSD